jgi:hypothetical protein
LIYSSLVGGSGDDSASTLALDATGNVYVAGQTNSADFPTMNGAQTPLPVAPNSTSSAGFYIV